MNSLTPEQQESITKIKNALDQLLESGLEVVTTENKGWEATLETFEFWANDIPEGYNPQLVEPSLVGAIEHIIKRQQEGDRNLPGYACGDIFECFAKQKLLGKHWGLLEQVFEPETFMHMMTQLGQAEEVEKVLKTNPSEYVLLGAVKNPNTPTSVVMDIYRRTWDEPDYAGHCMWFMIYHGTGDFVFLQEVKEQAVATRPGLYFSHPKLWDHLQEIKPSELEFMLKSKDVSEEAKDAAQAFLQNSVLNDDKPFWEAFKNSWEGTIAELLEMREELSEKKPS